MRSALLVILSSLYLTCATELHELFRLPYLVEHFREHRDQNPSLSLLDFLALHYSGNHPEDKDDSEDQQLPFKSGIGINHLDIQPATIREHSEKFNGLPESSLLTIHPPGMLTQRSFAVFHPPRRV